MTGLVGRSLEKGIVICWQNCLKNTSKKESIQVASKSKIAKAIKTPKYSTRSESRCRICGRPRAVYRKFGICRICFRDLADKGLIPGVKKASW